MYIPPLHPICSLSSFKAHSSLKNQTQNHTELRADRESLRDIGFPSKKRRPVSVSLCEEVEEIGSLVAIFKRRNGPDRILCRDSDWEGQLNAFAVSIGKSCHREEQESKGKYPDHGGDDWIGI